MSAKLVCRVCGAEYEGCRSAPLLTKGYRWQDVACCPEHGAEYLRLVMIARGELEEEQPESKKAKKKKNESLHEEQPQEILAEPVDESEAQETVASEE